MADTSTITLSPEYAAHFHYIYIDGKEHAKMTGDRMKMLMLTLPFVVHDLITPQVHYIHGNYYYMHDIDMYIHSFKLFMYVNVCTCMSNTVCTLLMDVHACMYQVLLINRAIDAAKAGSRLYKLPHVADPSDKIVKVLIQCMDWNIASRQSSIPQSELPDLQQKAVNLLDLLQKKPS